MKTYKLILVILLPVFLLVGCEREPEPVTIAIEFDLALDVPDHIQFASGAENFQFVLEPIEVLGWEVGPSPEVDLIETEIGGTFGFGEMTFYSEGEFAYRVFQMDPSAETGTDLVYWQREDLMFYVVVTVLEVEGELVATTAIEVLPPPRVNNNRLAEAITFTNTMAITFSGEWDRGIGDGWIGDSHNTAWRYGELHLKSSGEVDIYRQPFDQGFSMYWELTASGQLQLATKAPSGARRTRYTLTVEIVDGRLSLTDEHGTRRLFRSALEVIADEVPFIGVWQQGVGDDLPGLYGFEEGAGPREITFSETHHMRRTRDDHLFPLVWDTDELGDLVIETNPYATTFSFEVTGDTLTLTDEEGNTRSWIRKEALPDTPQDWVILDYLDYFEIPEGYRIFDNARIDGGGFDFVIYELTSVETEFSLRRVDQIFQDFVVVVKQDGEVFDVIHHQTYYTVGRMSHFARHVTMAELITVVDLDFDGAYDLLIFSHNSPSNVMYYAYVAHLKRDSGFEQATFIGRNWETGEELRENSWIYYIENPAIDSVNQVIFSEWRHWSITPSWSAFSFIDGEFIQTKSLLLHGSSHLMVAADVVLPDGVARTASYWTERTWTGYEWHVEELCTIPYGDFPRWGVHWDTHRFCVLSDEPHQVVPIEGGNVALYGRIFGEGVFWDITRRWVEEE